MLLSYGGTIGIICFLKIFKKETKSITVRGKEKKIRNYIKDIILVSISAQIVIMPIIAYNYKTISLTFFLTNILTSYLITLIIMFGLVIIIISFINIKFAMIFGKMYKLLINILQIVVRYTAEIPFSKIYLKTPYFWQIILYYLTIFYIYYLYQKFGKEIFITIKSKIFQKIRNKKIVAITLIITVSVSLIYINIPKELKIYFIDVGQGDSSLIITPQNTKILIDGGGSESYDIGKNILLPYLLNRRIDKIDYMICSHFDTDHVRTD